MFAEEKSEGSMSEEEIIIAIVSEKIAVAVDAVDKQNHAITAAMQSLQDYKDRLDKQKKEWDDYVKRQMKAIKEL